MIADFCLLVKANRRRENRGKEKRINTRKNYGSEVNSIARRGQGGIPLAGSRDSVPCGAWGNAPTVTPLNLLKEKSQAWHLGCRQRSVPAHKLPLPQERNPPSAKKVNYGSVRCEGVKGATAKPPCRLRRGETLCNTKINLLKPTKPQTSLPFAPKEDFPHAKNPPPVAQQTEEIDANST